MEFIDDALDAAKEALVVGSELTHVAGADTPIIGTIVNSAEAAGEYTQALAANSEGDQEAEDFHRDRGYYDLLKAVPSVGTTLGLAELMNGGVNFARGRGFKDGMEDVKDTTLDFAAMFGNLNPMGHDPFLSKGHDTWGSHTELRQTVEHREQLKKRLREQRKEEGER
jgi:hypothetical protein